MKIYVNINIQQSRKILQNYLKLLITYQQEIVWGCVILTRSVRLTALAQV